MAKVHVYTLLDIRDNCERVIKEIDKYNEVHREEAIQDLMNNRRLYFLYRKLDRKTAESYVNNWDSMYWYSTRFWQAKSTAEDLLKVVKSEACKNVVLTDEEFRTIFCYTYYNEETKGKTERKKSDRLFIAI